MLVGQEGNVGVNDFPKQAEDASFDGAGVDGEGILQILETGIPFARSGLNREEGCVTCLERLKLGPSCGGVAGSPTSPPAKDCTGDHLSWSQEAQGPHPVLLD